jgi:magnesium-transporting ATPase (P-type)
MTLHVDKVRKILTAVVTKTNKLKIARAPKIMVYWFLAHVLLCIVLFIAAWVYDWMQTGRGNLQSMTVFIQTLTSVSFIAAVAFFGKALIDDDGDGVPDEFERKDDKK